MSEFINKGIENAPFINNEIVAVISERHVGKAVEYFNEEVNFSLKHFEKNFITQDRIKRMSYKEIHCRALLIKMKYCE